MEDTTATASAVISLMRRLEDESEAFYKHLAEGWPKYGDAFLAFAKECEKSKKAVVRTYQETISDALEACFSFEGLDLESYVVGTALGESSSLQDAMAEAVRLEDRASEFYQDVAERSQALLATIARAFSRACQLPPACVPPIAG